MPYIIWAYVLGEINAGLHIAKNLRAMSRLGAEYWWQAIAVDQEGCLLEVLCRVSQSALQGADQLKV